MVRDVGQRKKTFDEILQAKWRGELETDDGRPEKIQGRPDAAKEEKALHKTGLVFYEPELLKLDTRVFVDARVNLCEELASETTSAE